MSVWLAVIIIIVFLSLVAGFIDAWWEDRQRRKGKK